MVLFKLFALVCAIAVPHAECTLDRWDDVKVFAYELPLSFEEAHSDLGCMRRSMFVMAPLAIAPREGVEYMKSVCVRSHDAPVG